MQLVSFYFYWFVCVTSLYRAVMWQQGRFAWCVFVLIAHISCTSAHFLCWACGQSCMRLKPWVNASKARQHTAGQHLEACSYIIEFMNEFSQPDACVLVCMWCQSGRWFLQIAPREEKYVTSEFCGCCAASMWKAPAWTHMKHHFTSRILNTIFFPTSKQTFSFYKIYFPVELRSMGTPFVM